MDALMQEALKAKSYPEIRYELASASLARNIPDGFVMHTKGKLAIGGLTRDMAMDVTALRSGDGGYLLSGEAPIRMTGYGIKPPTAMMGTIRTGDEVKVGFRWAVGRTK